MDHDASEGRPQLDYPCEWGYRVIAGQESHIRLAIRQAFGEHPVRLGATQFRRPLVQHERRHHRRQR